MQPILLSYVSEEIFTSIFRVENQLRKKLALSRWVPLSQKMAAFVTTAVRTSKHIFCDSEKLCSSTFI
jgi:hypothetical protein